MTISGGTFESVNGNALYEGIAKNGDVSAAAKSFATVSVTDGTFNGNEQKEAIAITTADNKAVVSGGTFSTSVKGYVVSGLNYEAVNGGEYTYHGDINSAVAAAGANGEIKNLKETPAQGSDHDVILKDGDTVVTTLRTSATSVDLPTLSKSGYTFKGWKDDAGKVHTGTFTLPSQAVTDNFYLTAVWSANSYYYYAPTTTDTKTDSPKTFDAGVGIYAVTALLSVTGMAWAGKKRH